MEPHLIVCLTEVVSEQEWVLDHVSAPLNVDEMHQEKIDDVVHDSRDSLDIVPSIRDKLV